MLGVLGQQSSGKVKRLRRTTCHQEPDDETEQGTITFLVQPIVYGGDDHDGLEGLISRFSFSRGT